MPEDFPYEKFNELSREFSIASRGEHILMALYFWKVHNDDSLLNKLFEHTSKFFDEFGMTSKSLLQDVENSLQRDYSGDSELQNQVWEEALNELGYKEEDIL